MTNEKLTTLANLLKELSEAVLSLAEGNGGEKEVATEPANEKKKETAVNKKREKEVPVKPEKKYTLVEVRKALSAKSGAGYTDDVRALLQKHGGNRLSEIAESEYASIMEEVKTIGCSQ